MTLRPSTVTFSLYRLFGNDRDLFRFLQTNAELDPKSPRHLALLLVGLDALKPLDAGVAREIMEESGGPKLLAAMGQRGVSPNDGAVQSLTAMVLRTLRQ